jgi:UDP-3-O-[3-hydroxymyristoyl] glucosamine N-acyltransferase
VRERRPFLPLNAQVSESALIHPSTIIEPGVVIGHHVVIGKNCYVQANAFIGDYTHMGDHVTIQVGAIIGTDAFYFQKTESGRKKWRSGGRVVIEDHVEIGAGCTVNKGVSGDTVIGAGTKLDCQVHVGHGAVIGKNCLIAGQVGIGGKSIIEDDVVLYGQVGVAQNVRIGKGAVVSAKSGVSKDLEGGKAYFGIPAAEIKLRQRELAALRKLPELLKRHFGE